MESHGGRCELLEGNQTTSGAEVVEMHPFITPIQKHALPRDRIILLSAQSLGSSESGLPSTSDSGAAKEELVTKEGDGKQKEGVKKIKDRKKRSESTSHLRNNCRGRRLRSLDSSKTREHLI